MVLQTWSETLATAFQNLWNGVIGFIPNVIVSIIIFIVGWVVGVTLEKWVDQLVKATKLDKALHTLGIEDLVEKAGYRLNSGAFLGALVKWFVIVAFLVATFDVLGLSQANEFLRSVLSYIPNVIVAVLILIVASVLSDAIKGVVTASAKAANVASHALLGEIAKWAIWIFAFFAAVDQLGIAQGFFQVIFTGLIAMLAIAGGIAFGLGGKDMAGRYLEKIKGGMH
jgi:hypothetical protein